jgi:sRNA-binding regulator protein Hfq
MRTIYTLNGFILLGNIECFQKEYGMVEKFHGILLMVKSLLNRYMIDGP